jgi:hypothetical protein
MPGTTEIKIEKTEGGAKITKDGAEVSLAAGEALAVDARGAIRLELAAPGAPEAPAGAVRDTVIAIGAAEGLRPAAITKDGFEVALGPDDAILISANGSVAKKSADAPAPAPEEPPAEKPALRIGDVMPDGTIYAGISPTTDRPLYAAPEDAPKRMSYANAAIYANGLKSGGKEDFRLPDEEELQLLYACRNKGALRGSFNTSAVYRSRTAQGRRVVSLQDGTVSADLKFIRYKVRCVRS